MNPKLVIAVATCLLAGAGNAVAQTVFTLSSAIDTARQSSPVLKAQYLNIGAAQADVITAKLRPNPNLNNQTLQLADAGHFPAGTKWSDNSNRQVWWQLTKPIQWPGQRKYRIESANQSIAVANNTYQENVRNLSWNVGSSWVNTWVLRKKLTLLQESRANLDSLVKINELRYKNQVITQTDLTRTQVLLQQYNLQLTVFFQDYNNELATLKLLTGAADSVQVDTSSAVETLIPTATLDSLINLSQENRSDVMLVKSTIAQTTSSIKYQKSLSWPQPELGVIYNPQNSVPYVGFFGTISLPIFDRNQGQIKKAEIQKAQAEQSLQATQLQVQTDVSTAYKTYLVQKNNIQQYSGVLQQSQQILDNVKYAYLRGGTTIIDFLDAQRNWYDTRLLYYDALQSYYQSYLQLLFVTGLINQL
ncbi:outer membrane protein, cobalt-zinc-cadmium efflux system [Chitinophaga rupis]|uniref:Outer membrane protein, cobalt-zinc-cadmium efflux system n=1 Tax=Chitinophaga rupis TaxID=573321 RepID=A0A1H7H3L6_9BACT|nr:TolC family protein [Chitinophaga rupis]SEK45003.1 outer membrane protein, cobalt-zinc-cadmium efflux system [Chitinophaga rupis]